MVRFLSIWLLSVMVVFSASADRISDAISAYNDAVSSTDPAAKLLAAEELGEAAMATAARDDAALLAFEAAKTLCLQNACETAKPFANWALAQGQSSESVPFEDFVMLSAYADWRTDANKATRAALDAALDETVDNEPSLLSVIIFQIRYSEDMRDEKWERGMIAAQQAADHFEPVRDVIGQQWSVAQMAAISSAFNDQPDLEQLYAFARLERELADIHGAFHDEFGDDEHPEWLDTNRYTAQAWRLATEAYFKSTSHKKPNQYKVLEDTVNEIVDYDTPDADLPDDDLTESLPFCDGEFRMRPALSYPSRAARKGQFGAVIMELSVADGKVSAVKPLASVPTEGFKESAAKTVAKWTWRTKVPKGEIGKSCIMDRDDIILPLIFALR